jgi:acetylornithine deacetylase
VEEYDVVAISAPIGEEGTGLPLNIDADMLAACISNALGAHHLRFVTSTAGVLREGKTVRSLDPRDETDFVTGRMKQKLRAARAAIDGGVAEVSICGRHSLHGAQGETRCWGAVAPVAEARLLTQAVEIPSVSGDERELARFLVGDCRDAGLEAFVDEAGNFVARKGSGPRRLLLLGHLDTVPFLWRARWNEGGLTGRGAVDAKSSLVNFIEVLRALDVPDGVEVRVVGATEEEVSSSRGAFHARDHYSADAVIVGEPSGSRSLTLGYFGLFKLRLNVAIPLVHSAAHQARSAPDTLYELVECLRQQVREVDPQGISSLIEVRSWQNVAGAHAEGILNFRVSPQARISPELVQDLEGVQVLRCTPGVSFGRTTSLARAFTRAFAAEALTARYVVKKGTCDMNTLATTWTGVPMVAYGPGNSALDHTMNEVISWEEYREANRVLAKAVNEWMRCT